MADSMATAIGIWLANAALLAWLTHKVLRLENKYAHLTMENIRLEADIKSTQDLVYRNSKMTYYNGEQVVTEC